MNLEEFLEIRKTGSPARREEALREINRDGPILECLQGMEAWADVRLPSVGEHSLNCISIPYLFKHASEAMADIPQASPTRAILPQIGGKRAKFGIVKHYWKYRRGAASPKVIARVQAQLGDPASKLSALLEGVTAKSARGRKRPNKSDHIRAGILVVCDVVETWICWLLFDLPILLILWLWTRANETDSSEETQSDERTKKGEK